MHDCARIHIPRREEGLRVILPSTIPVSADKPTRHMNKKPILFHDIDGVLYAEYDGEFQLRPNTKSWLKWVHQNFNVVWFSTWTEEDIQLLLAFLFKEQYLRKILPPSNRILVAPWLGFKEKEGWLSAETRGSLADVVEWYWIDDQVPPASQLKALGLDPEHCIQVNPKGSNELEHLKELLESRLLIQPRT